MSHFVIMNYALGDSFVQHFLVPLLQPLWFGDLLVRRVTVEDVIVAFAGRTGPDMTSCKPDNGEDGVSFSIVGKNLFPFVIL